MAIYGVLGDIHGNLEALQAALAALEARGVTRFACVGDIVGYNADPDACVEALRARDAIAIAGNHDLIGTGLLASQLGKSTDDAGVWRLPRGDEFYAQELATSTTTRSRSRGRASRCRSAARSPSSRSIDSSGDVSVAARTTA